MTSMQLQEEGGAVVTMMGISRVLVARAKRAAAVALLCWVGPTAGWLTVAGGLGMPMSVRVVEAKANKTQKELEEEVRDWKGVVLKVLQAWAARDGRPAGHDPGASRLRQRV